jgi:hypothetical protein
MAFSRLAQPRLSDRAGWCKDRLRRTELLTARRHRKPGNIGQKTWGDGRYSTFEAPMRREPPMALYELRTYSLYVGKMAEAVKLYQEIGFAALQKGGQDKKLVGYFQSDRGYDQSTCTPLEIR